MDLWHVISPFYVWMARSETAFMEVGTNYYEFYTVLGEMGSEDFSLSTYWSNCVGNWVEWKAWKILLQILLNYYQQCKTDLIYW